MAYVKTGRDGFQNIPFKIRAALGQFPRYSTNNKFGYNNAVGTSQEEIWNSGGVESYLSSAERMNIASTDADDASGDTGANTLTIYGLDNDWIEVNETITMNGTTNVLTTNSYIRVLRMIVNTAGSSGHNEGVITATAQTSMTVHGQINATDNQTLKINFGIPADKYGLITGAEIGCAKNEDIEMRFKVRPFGEVF